jgi:hypothetical protein
MLTDEKLDNLEFDVRMIEYEIYCAEQFASRMGMEFKVITERKTFINWERVKVWESFVKVMRQHNEFIQQLMWLRFNRARM